MNLTFLGATLSVTGSKYLLEKDGKKILIDCGLFQGLKELRLRNWNNFPVDPRGIMAIILTHAHIDHSGYIPRLINEGFKGRIICTPGTLDLCKILLPDSGHIQEEETQYAIKKGFSKHKKPLPLYSAKDAEKSLKFFETLDYHKDLEILDGLSFRFLNAGHILGASQVILADGLKKVCFTGDLGRPSDPILFPPETPEEVDYLVMESTYGSRLHPKIDPLEELKEVINRTVKRGGKLIIPSFAVGRTQLILFYLDILFKNKAIPEIPVFLNSPMAQDVTEIYCRHKEINRLDSNKWREICQLAKFVNSVEQSKSLNFLKEPAIIISASGMVTGGRVTHHLQYYGPDPKNTIVLTGFQAAGTRGEKILKGEPEVKIYGEMVPIRAEVVNLENMSAHPDQGEILLWAKNFKKAPSKVFLVHGEEEQSLGLKNFLKEKLNWNCILPQFLEKIDL
jgi:metallo-beta-lactamase family protein